MLWEDSSHRRLGLDWIGTVGCLLWVHLMMQGYLKYVPERAGRVTVLCIQNGSKWNDSYGLRTGDTFYRLVATTKKLVLKKGGSKLHENEKLTL